MKMQQLEYFVTVSQCGSLGKAAEKLFTSQPNVSKVIHSLETELGTPLFERNPRGLKLNEYGKAIFEYANGIMTNAGCITSICKQHIPETFSVSTFQSNSLARLLADLYNEYPNIRINHRQANIEEIVKNVETNISEIGIIYISNKHMQSLTNILMQKHLEFEEICTCRACVNAGPKSPIYERDSISYPELSGLHFVSGIQDYFSENNFSRENLGMAGSDAFSISVSSNCNQMRQYLITETDLVDFSLNRSYNGIVDRSIIKRIDITGDEAELAVGYIAEKGHVLSDPAEMYIKLISHHYLLES